MRRSPPHNSLPAPHMYPAPYPPDAMLSRAPHFRPEHLPHAYMYAPPPPHPMDHRPYEHPHDPGQPAYHPAMAGHMVPPMHARTDQHYAPYPSQQGTPVFTDDAATKLSERVRRRCFNCCTTDTSTWRRSNLSPGKVLCNKCGLFERTHSRPRPEQFPHKRGPLSSSTLRARTPPQNQLPPLSPPPNFHYPHHYPPHPRDFPSPPAALPSLQNWPVPPPNDVPSPKPARRPTLDSNGAPPDSAAPPSTSGSRAPTPPASRPASAEQASASAAAAA
ncbi:hypothetical protein C0992_007050 [Termitomyces sp. T32_za158]|nr:hypothetical protein C0992_007050 [Termitomyces sp. T32_za158]